MVSSGLENREEAENDVGFYGNGPDATTTTTWTRDDVGYDDCEALSLLEKKPLLPREIKRHSRCYVPKRYVLLFMVFVGNGLLYSMRINVSVTMPAMTNATYTTEYDGTLNQSVETCPKRNMTEATNENGEFLWTAYQQELVIAGFFYGYSVSQIPAGFLTDKIGGTRIFGIGLFISGVCSLLGPVAARMGPEFLLAVRIVCGFFEGGRMPSIGSMFSRWFPGHENSNAFAIGMAGAKIGSFLGTIVSGLLSSTDFLGGWPSTYYLFGFLSVAWALIWAFLIYESPHLHPSVSGEELDHLSSAVITEKTSKVTIPLKAMLLSVPVWAIIICAFVATWSNNTIFTNQPIYLKHVQGMDIELIGILSSIPHLAEGMGLMISSHIATKLINHNILSTVVTRKLMSFIGFGLSALAFLLLAYVGCNSALSVVFMTGALGFNGICMSGYYVNLMDIAPRLAGSIIGFVSTATAISGALVPYVIGVFTTNQADIHGWQTVFFISSGLAMLACLVFLLLGSGEEQEWAKSSYSSNDSKEFEKM